MDQNVQDYTTRIEKISFVLKSEFKYLYLASLISAETIYDKQTAEHSLEKLQFIKDNIKLLNLDAEERKEIQGFVNKGIRICNQEIERHGKE